MKAEQTLKAIKDWAKKNGQKIKVGIRKQPPKWIPAEQRVKSEGVALELYASDDPDSKAWQYWFTESGQNWRYLYEQYEEFESFKNTEKFIELLDDQANEITFFIFFSEIFSDWAEKNGYEVGDHTLLNNYGQYLEAREYSPKDDPEIANYSYASKIGFKCGKIVVQRMVAKPYKTKESGYKQVRGEWMARVASNVDGILYAPYTPIRTKKALLTWLNENASTGYVSDYTAASLDKKTAKKILKDGNDSVYLYETESASDEAIKALCNPRNNTSIHLSEFALSCLSDDQIAMLINYARNGSGKIFFDIGILSDSKISAITCKNLSILDKSFDLNNWRIFVALYIDEISDKCAAMLAQIKCTILYTNEKNKKKVASFALKKTKNTASKKKRAKK